MKLMGGLSWFHRFHTAIVDFNIYNCLFKLQEDQLYAWPNTDPHETPNKPFWFENRYLDVPGSW